MMAAGSTLPFFGEPALAQLSKISNIPADAVMINANENPLGPSPEALAAAQKICINGGRYLYAETDATQALLAQQEGLKTEYVRMFPGSSAPLHQGPLAFCSPTKSLCGGRSGVMNPADARQLLRIKAPVVKIPLLKDKRLRTRREGDVSPVKNAGLIYICNPNNPSGTMTPRADIEWLVANKPAEARSSCSTKLTRTSFRMHISAAIWWRRAKTSSFCVLSRRFMGLAGLRAGAVFARPDLMDKLFGLDGQSALEFAVDYRYGGGAPAWNRRR